MDYGFNYDCNEDSDDGFFSERDDGSDADSLVPIYDTDDEGDADDAAAFEAEMMAEFRAAARARAEEERREREARLEGLRLQREAQEEERRRKREEEEYQRRLKMFHLL